MGGLCMVYFELHNNFFSFNRDENYLSMVRAKNVKAIESIIDFDNTSGLLTANIRDSNDKIYEEYFDFGDVLRDLGKLKNKQFYFSGINKEDICIRNL